MEFKWFLCFCVRFQKITQKFIRIFFIINALNNWKHSFGWLLTDKQADWKPYECYWWDGKINNKHLLTTFKPLMNINFKIFILKRQHRITEILLITGMVKMYSDSKKFTKGFRFFFPYFLFCVLFLDNQHLGERCNSLFEPKLKLVLYKYEVVVV